jgi:hypothetical protein
MVTLAPTLARADGLLEDAGVGAGTALLNLVYIPLKLTYATLGAVTGGLAYALTVGRTDTARNIWEPTMGGTYALSPDMLRGDRPIYFSGKAREDEGVSSLRETPAMS